MAMFGSSWLEDIPYEDGGMFSSWKKEEDYTYYQDESGNYHKVTNMKEYYKNLDENNLFEFDGSKYTKKLA